MDINLFLKKWFVDREQIAIHTPTKNVCDQVCDILQNRLDELRKNNHDTEFHLEGSDYSKLKSNWNTFKEDTVIYNNGCYGRVIYAKEVYKVK